MATLAQDIINSAMRLVGALASGEQPTNSESADALAVFQQMIDAWNAERLAIYTTSANDFPFVAGQQAYTLGPSGNFNMARPAQIDGVSAIVLSNPANPLELPLAMYTVDQWQTKVPVKAVASAFPLLVYDDGNFPLRTLNFWPYPNTSANSVRIYSWQPLSQPAALNTAIAFPPGYAEAFRYNLAMRLGPEFQAPVPADVAQIATESMARIRTMNVPEQTLESDLVPQNPGWNYRADMFNLPY